jgi:hypothetical protein
MSSAFWNDALRLSVGGLPGGFALDENLDPPIQLVRVARRREVKGTPLAEAGDLNGRAVHPEANQHSPHCLGSATGQILVTPAGALVVGVPDEDDACGTAAA